MISSLCLVLCLVFLFQRSDTASVSWKPDVFQFSSSAHKVKPKVWTSTVTVSANGPFYTDQSVGNFRLTFAAHGNFTFFNGSTDCISISANTIQTTAAINSMKFSKYGHLVNGGSTYFIDYNLEVPFSDLFSVSVKKFGNVSTYTSSFQMTFTSINKAMDSAINQLSINTTMTGCAPAMTLGNWNDPKRWSTGQVPGVSDSVTIPTGSGIIQMASSVSVASLTMQDGTLVGHATSCPDGWSVDPISSNGIKCYLLHEELLPYAEADTVCNSVGFSSTDAHLMQIRNRQEMITALRLCRGPVGSPAYVNGCWIGLRDPSNTGNFDWINTAYVGSSTIFLDWRRGEPNNHTSSDGVPTNGEQCTQVIAWQEDPLIQEQGSWNDESCHVSKPFICQIYANTFRYTLTTSGTVTLTGGKLEGGYLKVGLGVSTISHFEVHRSAVITLGANATNSVIHTLLLTDGSELVVSAPKVWLASGSFIGEPVLPAGTFTTDMQPRVSTKAGTVLEAASVSHQLANVTVNARAKLLGGFVGDANSVSTFKQGGEFSQSSFLLNSNATLNLDGYGARLSSYDAFELTLSNRGPFIGEYYGLANSAQEAINMHKLVVVGVYRLKVTGKLTGSSTSTTQTTNCIPYNATIAEMTARLNALSLVADRGGVTVRRYGNKDSSRFGFGFTYRIEMDAPTTSKYALGPLTVDLSCYGIDNNCGCGDTKVPLTDENGNNQCPSDVGVIAAADANACVYPPTIGVTRISTMSYTNTSGTGTLLISSGAHRLPPKAHITIQASAGTGIVAADTISWYGLSSVMVGRLVLAGTGWLGWDSANVLYAPDWTTERGLVRELSAAPPFLMTAQHFYLDGYGSILSSCPTSNMTWTKGSWAGGFIGGRSTLFITDTMNAVGSNKALRFGLTLYITSTAHLNWYTGNISLADGADIFIEGTLQVNATQTPVFIGEAQLLQAPVEDEIGNALLSMAGGRNYHSYYGDELVAELRGGWYQNPLCGSQCFDTNQILVRGNGRVRIADWSVVNFFVPLNLVGATMMVIGHDVDLTLQSGGTCGNGVIIDISHGTNLVLSGGQMAMQALCTIRGEGELLVSAGSHDLAFSIDAHITISGGTMVWPLSRGSHGTLTFNGGMLIQNTGKLSVEPSSTDIVVHNTVELKDQSMITFPLLGIAAQASLFDEQDAPDASPRGSFTATGVMRWEGGTLLGKADFNVLQALYLDGTLKYIRSLAKLVNKGHCEWGSGNLIADNQGDFLNFGTIQMSGGVNLFKSSAMYRGTELPLENGGDVFALEYHSYDMDMGGLSYDQYVQLRTEFVSRAPNT